MITKTFEAPIGTGLRTKAVAPQANATGRNITVIVPHPAVFDINWSKRCPTATGISPLAWLNRATDAPDDLIIVDCISADMMARIGATLSSIATEVWVVSNGDDALIPVQSRPVQQSIDDIGRLIRISRGVFNDGISVPDVQGFVVGDRGVIPFAADVSGSGRDWSLPTKAQKRAHAIATADITRISQDDLDALLAPLLEHGLLVTSYQCATGTTEYRGPSGRVLAVSIGTHHFAHRDAMQPGSFSMAQHAQRVGRVTRITAERAQ